MREPYYANWYATVDGRSATVRLAAGFLLAVLIDAGSHEVWLGYREPGLVPGALVALGALLRLPPVLRRACRFGGTP
jgi:uncharacterized membrane protein YfhO